MKVIGFLLMIAAVVAFVYFGVWWAFIGGIVDIVQEVGEPEISAMNIAIGVAKVIFFELIGGIPAFILGGIGYVMLES